MTDEDYEAVDTSNWLECHKRSMNTINQDPIAPVSLRHLIVESTVQLKLHQKKGSAIDRC